MDELDREILGVLQRDARISYRDLGLAVGLSSNATADRVRRLQKDGVIRGFTTLVDHARAAGDRLTVFIDVRLRSDQNGEEFEAALGRLAAVTEAVHVTGAFDYLLRAEVSDAAGLDRLIRELKRSAGVSETQTRLALRTVVGLRAKP